MSNEKQQIEEMCKDFKCCVSCEMFGGYVDDDGSLIDPHCIDYSSEHCKECYVSTTQAKVLVNAGYRNCKDKVVLTREEYSDYLILQQNQEFIREKSKELQADNERLYKNLGKFKDSVRKETAREIIEYLQDNGRKYENWYLINELKKQYGVEVE